MYERKKNSYEIEKKLILCHDFPFISHAHEMKLRTISTPSDQIQIHPNKFHLHFVFLFIYISFGSRKQEKSSDFFLSFSRTKKQSKHISLHITFIDSFIVLRNLPAQILHAFTVFRFVYTTTSLFLNISFLIFIHLFVRPFIQSFIHTVRNPSQLNKFFGCIHHAFSLKNNSWLFFIYFFFFFLNITKQQQKFETTKKEDIIQNLAF